MPRPDCPMTIVSDDAVSHGMLALVSHDACCMWHECMAWCNAATGDHEIKFRKSSRSQTDSDRNSFAAKSETGPTAQIGSGTCRHCVECPEDRDDAVHRLCAVDYAKAWASCGTQCARSSSPSTTIASQLFFNGFPNCAPDEGDACNDLRLLLLKNHPRLVPPAPEGCCARTGADPCSIFQHIQPAETRDAQDALVVRRPSR